MIVKNDAVRLRRCLNSVGGIVDEVVIVDTGSSDKSVEVAEEFGAHVVQIPWPGAFDVAINTALDQVDTEWTLRLDSDEWFEPTDAAAVRPLIDAERAFGYYFVRRDTYDGRAPSEILLLRLWRTHERMRFEGIVHEHIPTGAMAEAAENRFLQAAPIVIQHDGYAGGALTEKRLRNIALLEEMLSREPDDFFTELCLAEALVANEDQRGFDLTEKLVDKVLETPLERQASPLTPWALGLSLERCKPQDFFSARTQSIVRYVLKWHFDNPVALWGVALLESNRGNLFAAYHALLELEEMGLTGNFDRLGGTPLVFVNHGAWEFLGNLALALGKTDVASRNYQRLLSADPSHPVALSGMKELV
jgi:glycosyltransferase involved in cell wall biosynthesis